MIANGVHFGLSEQEYSDIQALRSTFLRAMLRTTPKQAFADDLAGGGVDSFALEFGRLFHGVTLEPDRVEPLLIDIPDFAGKGARAMKAEWMLRNAERIPVKPKIRSQLLSMRDAVYRHPLAGQFFTGPGRSEASIVWDDPMGFKAKSRIDRLYPRGGALAIAELKSTRNAQEELFRFDCGQYEYPVEVCFQLRALDMTQGEYQRPVHFVACEKQEPYRVEVYELTRSERTLGWQKTLKAMEIYAECKRTGVWPDVPIFGAKETA